MTDAARAKERFLDLLDLPEAERPARLAALEAEDPELARRVRSLLAAHGSGHELLEQGPTLLREATAGVLGPGSRVGAFELEELLGEGGFARVWRARQLEPVVREVALKLLRPGVDSTRVVARFEAERQALALMDHPGIATVLDGGATADGQPWFAMELVDGPPLTGYARDAGLSVDERVRLLLETCRAVQHAHQKGVVHRDLKPSNVLVARVDGRAQPKVIDFGIAKAIDQPLLGDATMTLEGQLVGTPAYMAPEQATAGADLDTRCDVYALGVLLYELLTDERPFEDQTLGDLALDEALRVVREVDPPRPSVRLARSHPARARRVRGDLDWIVMRCLEKDPERRYDSAGVLANELERFLRGEPVLAGPPTLGYRTARFVQRHRLALAVGALLLAVLVGGVVVSTTQLLRALDAEAELSDEVERTAVQLGRFRDISTFYEGVLMGLDPAFAREEDTTLLRRVLEDAEARIESERPESPVVEATVRRAVAGAYHALGQAEAAERQMRAALALRDAHLDPDDPDRLRSLHELGTLLVEEGRPEDGEPYLEEALERRARVLGPEHAETLRTRGNLGVVRRGQLRLDEARELLQGVLDALAAQDRLDDEEGIRILNNLAGVIWDQGERDLALGHYRDALDLQLVVHGEGHPETLKAFNNLGHALAEEGQLDEALEILRRALDAKVRVLPAGHPSLLIGWNNLATLQERADRPEAAVESYSAAVASAEEGGTGAGRTALMLRRNQANFLDRLGRAEEARAVFRSAGDACRAAYGEDDPLTVILDNELGWNLSKAGEAEAALALLRSSEARAVEHLHPDDPKRPVLGLRLGLYLHELGRDGEAREVLERHLEGARKHAQGDYLERTEAALAAIAAAQGG